MLAGWSADTERRNAPLRTSDPQARVRELSERVATWKAWRNESGGRAFIERGDECVYVIRSVDNDGLNESVLVCERDEAFRLIERLRERGINVSMTVRKRRR